RVGEASFDRSCDLRPAKREGDGLVQANRAGVDCLRNHVGGVLPFEDVWIRKMKWFSDNAALVGPGAGIVTGGERNFTASGFSVHDFKKHEPGVVAAQHEWIGDERGGYVRDVGFRQHGAIPIEFERRRTAVDGYGPHKKDFSRKGAKAQRRVQGFAASVAPSRAYSFAASFASSFAPLRLCARNVFRSYLSGITTEYPVKCRVFDLLPTKYPSTLPISFETPNSNSLCPLFTLPWTSCQVLPSTVKRY